MQSTTIIAFDQHAATTMAAAGATTLSHRVQYQPWSVLQSQVWCVWFLRTRNPRRAEYHSRVLSTTEKRSRRAAVGRIRLSV
jgi:hypothetical protein